MARPPMFKVQEKQRIVLSVLRGECSVAEAARRQWCSETSIAKWRDQFVQGGMAALEESARRGPSTREAQLERELAEVVAALGEAHVQLRLRERDTRRVSLEELEMIRQDAGLRMARFCALAGISQSSWYRRRARVRRGGEAVKGPWPAPKRWELEAVVHWLALRYPAWGYRKIWALAAARGYQVSLSTVYRIMFERGLVHEVRYQAERRELAKARRAVFVIRRGGATGSGRPTSSSCRRVPAGAGSWAVWSTTSASSA